MYEAPKAEKAPRDAESLMRILHRREAVPADSRVAVVVAHQDDESIAFGAQIPRFPGCLMVHVTDGAPNDPKEWKGFSREEYAQIREREMSAALDDAGHTGERVSFGSPDQEAAFRLEDNARTLADLFRKNRTAFVLTHAYEGGHPDHDASAFIVHAAKRILEKEGVIVHVIEAPLYRMQGSRSVRQKFIPVSGARAHTFRLDRKERALKERLYADHASQSGVLSTMSTTTEWLRKAPEYDFTGAANGGNLSRLFGGAGIGKEKWESLAREALDALGLSRA
jgi:LmbE family N-acetylglucosaminyl deacetylase